ncbi:hypothetical protein KQH27_00500 [bacterium]|nr:hypothetical protein [bacterium]
MDWPSIITIVLGSSVLGTALTSLFSWISQKRTSVRHNSFLALTISHLFEEYAHTCLTLVSEDDLYFSSGGHAGSPMGTPPKPFKLPEESYRDFDIKLLDRILEFPQKVLFGIDEVGFMATVADEDEANATAHRNAINLAIQALSLADSLRKKYNLPKRDLKFGTWDLRDELKKQMKSIKKE